MKIYHKLAAGFPADHSFVASVARNKELLKEWKYSRELFITHPGEMQETLVVGEIFVQQDLLETLQKLVDAEQQALKAGTDQKKMISL